jgi:Zn-finger nucleic acid-binding protein
MKCPHDGAVLTMSERSGVEIDYCPDCRGVWLDRGELDKILDRVASEAPPVPAAAPREYQQRPEASYQAEFPTDRGRGHRQGSRKPKRKEHWLSELFD